MTTTLFVQLGANNLVPNFDVKAFLQYFNSKVNRYDQIFTTPEILMELVESDTNGNLDHLTPLILSSEPMEDTITFSSTVDFLENSEAFSRVLIILPESSLTIASSVDFIQIMPYEASGDLRSNVLTSTLFQMPNNFEQVSTTGLYKKIPWNKSVLLSVPLFSEEEFTNPFSGSVQFIKVCKFFVFLKKNQIIAVYSEASEIWCVNQDTNNNREFNRIPEGSNIIRLSSSELYTYLNTHIAQEYMDKVA